MEYIKFFDQTTIKEVDLCYPDIYFTPEYGLMCEYSDSSLWELCMYKDLIYVYMKKPYLREGTTYYKLLTPYGYSGFYYKDINTYNEFIPLFRETVLHKNYISEVVRQSPYLGIELSHYDIIKKKDIFSIEISQYPAYLKKINSKTRNMISKGDKLNFSYEINIFKNNPHLSAFITLYNHNMNKVSATPYYYFNNDYFEALENNKYCNLITIFDTTKNIVGMSLIFFYKDFIHYHLSCNDQSSNCITNFLLNTIVKEFGEGKKIILGGGINNFDSLYKFKQNISTTKYDYIIYENILNKEMYNKINNN